MNNTFSYLDGKVCCKRCGCLMDSDMLPYHPCAASIQPRKVLIDPANAKALWNSAEQELSCDAWDSRCTQYRAVLARIADRTAFDTVTELKDMARKAIA